MNQDVKRQRKIRDTLELELQALRDKIFRKTKMYKALESMVHEVKTDISSSISVAPTVDKNEKGVVRLRGSSSPFRCISSLIHQTNMEKEQELSTTKIRMQEHEAFAASQQKEDENWRARSWRAQEE